MVIESEFVPSCVICREPVPEKRRHPKTVATCSEEHAAQLKQYNEDQVALTKCPHCYHPSTPEEREDFKNWRRSRGELHDRRGRPRQTNEEKFRKALLETETQLRSEGNSGLADRIRKVIEDTI
jgi:hypothetical protein